MKKEFSYYQFKWTAFFIAILIIGFTVAGYLSSRKDSNSEIVPSPTPAVPQVQQNGFISNHSFAQLIEANLQELELLENVSFQGGEDGDFNITATITSLSTLAAVADELKPYQSFLGGLKGKNVRINGHLSENELGNGMLTVHTIVYSGHTIPAAAVTPYLEKYTSLNDLVDVPFHEITINQSGITFADQIPAFIQTAFDNPDEDQALFRE